jgi:hypothetical protein
VLALASRLSWQFSCCSFPAAARWYPPASADEKNVFPHRQVGKQHRLLRHQIDAQLMRQRRVKARKRAFADRQFTAVRRFDPGDDLHQRRFSRAVTAHQRMHLARAA